MTHEEAKKIGATHYLNYNGKDRFYKWCENDGLFRLNKKCGDWFWVDYFLDEILKPL